MHPGKGEKANNQSTTCSKNYKCIHCGINFEATTFANLPYYINPTILLSSLFNCGWGVSQNRKKNSHWIYG